MSDEIIEELWRIKDAMAREHGYDVGRLAAYLQGKKGKKRNANSPAVAAAGTVSDGPKDAGN